MKQQPYWKTTFDFIFSIILVILLLPLLIFLLIIASFDTKSLGIFLQSRIGQYGKPFVIYKFKTISDNGKVSSKMGLLLRKLKLDELPQLFNILKGEMSFVGPRPDISGYYDQLQGKEREVLQLKPGLTCEASIKYSDEDVLLKEQNNPLQYNDEVLFPIKVEMNLNYLEKMSLKEDLRILMKTIFKILIK